jgi:hypothetical protein
MKCRQTMVAYIFCLGNARASPHHNPLHPFAKSWQSAPGRIATNANSASRYLLRSHIRKLCSALQQQLATEPLPINKR